MTPKQFWDEDEDLIFIYQKAYVNNLHSNAYVIGAYVDLAFSTTYYNYFGRKNKNEKVQTYPKEEVFNPFLQKQQAQEKPKTYLSSVDLSKNNNAIFGLKKMAEERRKQNGRVWYSRYSVKYNSNFR